MFIVGDMIAQVGAYAINEVQLPWMGDCTLQYLELVEYKEGRVIREELASGK